MKYWVAIVLLLLSTVAYPETRVQVEGQGRTEKEAIQDAFNTAIRQVVGEVIVSNQEISKGNLTKDFVGSYSAGFIKYSETLETRYDLDKVIVKMNVLVESSKIAQRMMSNGNKNLIIEGQYLQEQIDSILEYRSRGDTLIAEVLNSYPYNAFVVNAGQTDIAVNNHREVYIDVPYDIHWSNFWLQGINEALQLIALDSKSCNDFWYRQDQRIRLTPTSRMRDTPCGQEADFYMDYKMPGDWLSQTYSYYFQDKVTLEVINKKLQTSGRQHIGLVVELKDADGQIIGTRCRNIDTSTMISYTEPQFEVSHWNNASKNVKPSIYGEHSVYGILRIHTRSNENIRDIARVSLTISKTCT